MATPSTSSRSIITVADSVATTSSATTTSNKSYVVVAMAEGRGATKGEIGLACMDIRNPEVWLAQFTDTASYTKLRIKLNAVNPAEIIVPDSAVEKGGNMLALIPLLQEDLPKTQIVPIARKNFNENQAVDRIKSLKTVDCSTIEKDLEEKFYCLSCTTALLSYVEHIQNIVFAANSMKFLYKDIEETCMIDPTTAKNLELIVSLKDITNSDKSLFGVLNRAFTVGGQRMLRASILQPSADLNVIQQRLDAIEELLSNENTFTALRSLTSRMHDVDQLVALCSYLNKVETPKTAEYKLTQLIYLKHTLELVEPLRNTLQLLNSILFQSYNNLLNDDRFETILSFIKTILNDDVRVERAPLNMKMQKCYAVKSNINGLLDLARRTYGELVADVTEESERVGFETHFSFKVSYSNSRGFYLSLYVKNGCFPKHPPEILMNVVQRNNLITCTTSRIVQLNDRINEVVNEILLLSNATVSQCLENIRYHITCLFNLSEVISSVDFLTSLAYVSTISTTCMRRPNFMDGVALKQAVHPILEKFSTTHLTPNDVSFSDDLPGRKFCNNYWTKYGIAGKSTYLKMVATLQIMAQMGSYVPAEMATFRLTDQIFSRLSHNDDLENGLSGFQVEMMDIKYIVENFTDNSLVIIDELCRSTSAEEGLALCVAISEHFIARKAFVILSTHLLDLTNLDGLYPNVSNYHFAPQNRNDVNNHDGDSSVLVLDHSLKRGPYRGPLYGFEVAALSSMPAKVIARAKQLATEIHAKRQMSIQVDEKARKKERAIMKLSHKLEQISQCPPTDKEELRKYFKRLQAEYWEEIGETPSTSGSSAT